MSNFKTQKTLGCYPGAFCCQADCCYSSPSSHLHMQQPTTLATTESIKLKSSTKMSPLPQSGWKWETTWMKDTTEKLLIVLYMKYSRYLKLMSEGNTMNDAIAMMFSILIVMFGYLVFKIRTDQSQSTTASTRKRSKKRGTGKPVSKITGICDHWTQKILQTKICGMRILQNHLGKKQKNNCLTNYFTKPGTRAILNLDKKVIIVPRRRKPRGAIPGLFVARLTVAKLLRPAICICSRQLHLL